MKNRAKVGRGGGKPRMSDSRHLSHVKVSLIRSTNPAKTLSTLRTDIPSNLYSAVIDWIRSSPYLDKRIFNRPFPVTPHEWGTCLAPASIPPHKEFKWCSSYLTQYLDRIAGFAVQGDLFEKAFVRGDHKKCGVILDQIHSEYGLSLWWVKKKLVYLQETDGLEAQKKFALDIQRHPGFQTVELIPYLTFYLSYRTESAVTPDRFEQIYPSIINKSDFPSGFKSYLYHHILPGPIRSIEDIAAVLRYESPSSAIDYYETFIAMAQMVLAGKHEDVYETLAVVCQKFVEHIPDIRIKRILFELGMTGLEEISATESDILALDLFLKGKYSDSIDTFLSSPDNMYDAGALQLIAMCYASVKEEYIKKESCPHLLSALRSVIAGDADSDVSKSKLKRIAWALEGNPVSHLTRAILLWESHAFPRMSDLPDIEYEYYALGKLHPILQLWATEDDILLQYRTHLSLRYASLVFNHDIVKKQGMQFLRTFSEYVAEESRLWINTYNLLDNDNYGEALSEARFLIASDNPFFRRVAIRVIMKCLLRLKQFAELLNELVILYLHDPSVVGLLPIEEIIITLNNESCRKSLSSLICFPIVCNIYATQKGPSFHYLRNYACEDFLSSNGLKRPSETSKLSCDAQQLTYYLREICTEQVMDTWVVFNSSQEVARERVEICQLLIKLDPANTELYQGEIKNIMRRLTIKSKLREIEQSKIYIDIDSVMSVAKRDLKETYSRYISFLHSGLSKEDVVVRENARKMLSGGDVAGLLSLVFPRNEMSALFESMILRLRDEFVSSSQHGLDGYLSVRIRHGTLSGHLRAPLESESLLTHKDAKTNKHKPNEFWLGRLAIRYSPDRDALIQTFAVFSESFDNLVNTVKTEWLQIKKDSSSNGLFNFTLHNVEIDFLS